MLTASMRGSHADELCFEVQKVFRRLDEQMELITLRIEKAEQATAETAARVREQAKEAQPLPADHPVEMEKRIFALEKQVKHGAARNAVLEKLLRDAETRIANLGELMQEGDDRITNLEVQMKQGASRITLLETAVREMRGRQSLEKRLDELQKSCQESDERFKAVEQTLEPLQMDVQHLQASIATMEGQTTSVSSPRRTSGTCDVAKLEGRVAQIQKLLREIDYRRAEMIREGNERMLVLEDSVQAILQGNLPRAEHKHSAGMDMDQPSPWERCSSRSTRASSDDIAERHPEH